ncbi:hypothetical protein [Paraburkholderia sp.]|uniref:hypothetical protein n=1 Tax=Paraburkholderia sp. TaxID=1926495 RepID=UPI003D700C97
MAYLRWVAAALLLSAAANSRSASQDTARHDTRATGQLTVVTYLTSLVPGSIAQWDCSTAT